MLGLPPLEIIIAIGGLIATVISYFAGGRNAKSKDRADRAEQDLKAMQKRMELKDELKGLSDDERDKRLDRWVREAE